MTSKRTRTIKFWAIIMLVVVAFVVGGIMMLKYEVEGEKNLPYTLSKITIICTAEGVETEPDSLKKSGKWDLNIIQTNDIYISIDKNEKVAENKALSSVKIDNIKITKNPGIGAIKAYMPNSLDGRIYKYSDDYLIGEHLEYMAAEKSNPKTLEIGSQGGMACISFANSEIGTYSLNNKKEITHNGKLIALTEATQDDLKFSVSFDITINVEGTNYKTTVNLDLPCGEIIENGTATQEITDFSNLIFKRIH